MYKILLVSIASPPKSDPESLQVARYIKYLSKAGCDIEVISSANPTLYMEPDKALEVYNEGVSRMLTFSLFEYRYLNAFINRFFPSLNQYPDPKWSFRFFNLNRVTAPDLIYSRSYPISSTLLALKLKKKWNVPWLLHLSDPWAISYEGDSPATNFRAGPRKWNAEKELECFSLADKISLTSTKTIDLYKKVYPQFENKFILTPNVFDEETLNELPVDFRSKLRVTCTGGFGEKRSPLFYLRAIQEFLKQNPEAGPSIEFVFTGPMTRANKSVFESFGSTPQIIHVGLIPYQKVIDLQQKAHILVNIDTDIPNPEHSVFFPSKLLEYFAANRRVLNIGNQHAMSWQIITNKYGDCVEFDDFTQLKNLLKIYWQKFQERDEDFFTLHQSFKEYGARHNAEKLLLEIKRIVKQKLDLSPRQS